MTKSSLALEQFRICCNTLSSTQDDTIRYLSKTIRSVMEAVYCQRMGMRRHLDDLEAEGVLGLVEGVRGGLTGDDLYRYVLQHVELHRMKPMQAMTECQMRADPADPVTLETFPDPRPSPEQVAIIAQSGPEPVVKLPKPRDLKPAIARLSSRDQRIIDAYYRQGRTVRVLAAELGIAAPTLVRHLQRIRNNLRVLVDLPELTPAEIRRDLTGVVSPQQIPGYDPVEALTVYYETFSQSETADRLGVAQERVSYTVRQAVQRLATIHRLQRYYRAFDIIHSNQWRWSRR